MFDWNRWLFSRIAAGHQVDAPLIPAARWIAEQGATVGILMLLALWCLRPRQRAGVLGVAVVAMLAAAVAHALADAFAVPRPFVTGDSAPWIAHGGRGAFPSAHATVMFAVTFGLWPLRGLRAAALAMGALALVTAWARIHGGLHYPMDIVGGAALAAVLVYGLRFIALWLRARWAPPRTPPAAATLAWFGGGLAAVARRRGAQAVNESAAFERTWSVRSRRLSRASPSTACRPPAGRARWRTRA